MIGAIAAFLFRNRLGQVVLVIAAGLLLVAAGRAWLAAHDRNVADVAREGYVLLAEKAAAEAKAAELQRQVTAGAQALEEHRKRLAAAEIADEQQTAEREQEILAYEALLSQANRRCALSRDDIDFLQRDRAAPDNRGGRAGKGAGGRKPA